jgi:hypothetical protein
MSRGGESFLYVQEKILHSRVYIAHVHCHCRYIFKNLYFCCRLTLNTHFILPIANGKALVNSYNYQKRVDELPHTFARSARRPRKYGNGTARKLISRRKGIIDM